MKTSTKISKNALREFVRDMLDNKANAPAVNNEPVTNVNPVLDVQQQMKGDGTQAINPSFVPQTTAELADGIKHLVDNVDELDIPGVYTTVKNAIEDQLNKDSEISQMKKTNKDDVKESLRLMIRKIIAETETKPWDDAFDDKSLEKDEKQPRPYTAVADEDENEDDEYERNGYQQTEDGGETLDTIAKELGYANTQGVRAAVISALKSAAYMINLDPDERETLTLIAMDDYIKYLKSSGELTEEDVMLLRAHPNMVVELDGFREHMAKFIKAGIRNAGEKSLERRDDGDEVY